MDGYAQAKNEAAVGTVAFDKFGNPLGALIEDAPSDNLRAILASPSEKTRYPSEVPRTRRRRAAARPSAPTITSMPVAGSATGETAIPWQAEAKRTPLRSSGSIGRERDPDKS